MALLLRFEGYEVDVAHEGKAALERARAKPPDVVVLDLSMPGMSGYEVARQLRALLHNKVRLVAISAHGCDEDRRRCRAAGFDRHLVKPADPIEVLNFLRGD
jgi:CheY-like chemotaxis protein